MMMNTRNCFQPVGSALPHQDLVFLNNNNHLPGVASFVNTDSFQVSQASPGPLNFSDAGSDLSHVCATSEMSWNGASVTEERQVLGKNGLLTNIASPSALCEHQGSQVLGNSVNSQNWPESTFKLSQKAQTSAGVNGGHGFTFTTPTQSYLHSPSLTATSPNRYQYGRATPPMFAPTGCSAQWQHSIPQRIPWSKPSLSNQQGISVFTGALSPGPSCTDSVQSIPVTTQHWSSQPGGFCTPPKHINYPVASCSEYPRRPKRHASENLEYLSPENKVHLTEEKIAEHMRDLNIHCVSSQLLNSEPSSCPGNSLTPGNPNQSIQSQQWKNFQEIEEKLEVSDEEGGEEDMMEKDGQPRLHIVEDLKTLVKKETGLPEEIIAEIQKPRMELILWTPPDEAVKKVVKQVMDRDTSSLSSTEENEMSDERNDICIDEDGCMDTDTDYMQDL